MKLCSWVALSLLLIGVEANNCSTLYELFNNIFSTDDNLYQLNKVFYPPRAQPPTFVNVTYIFKDKGNNVVRYKDAPTSNLSNCTVNYIWAEGGFLLIQPPSIFQLTSLLFNQKRGEENNISLTLPSECSELVKNGTDDCECGRDDYGNKLLDIATQQLELLAKYNEASKVVRDDTVHAYAICKKRLEDVYYVIEQLHSNKAIGVIIFFTILISLPLITITLTTAIIRSLHKGIHVRLIRPSNHKTVAGFVLMGMFVTFFILGCDITAVIYYVKASDGESELGYNKDYKRQISFFCTAILLALDGLAFFKVVLVLFYVCCKNVNENTNENNESCNTCFIDRGVKICYRGFSTCCLTKFLSCFFYMSFFGIFGTLKQEKAWKVTFVDHNKHTVWVIALALVGPIFTINTHVGFILVSWLTDSSQASSVVLFYLAALTYLFFMFRQCYQANVEIKPERCCWSILLPLYPFRQFFKYLAAYAYLLFCCNCCSNSIKAFLDFPTTPYYDKCQEGCCCYCRRVHDHVPLENFINQRTEFNEKEDENFNTRAFCIVFCWGWVLVLPLAMAFFALAELPIKTIDLLSDLLNTFQVLILLVSLLITYKIVSLSETDVSRFLKKMRKMYIALTGNEGERPEARQVLNDFKQVDDVEAAACLVGEIADVVIHKLPSDRERPETQDQACGGEITDA